MERHENLRVRIARLSIPAPYRAALTALHSGFRLSFCDPGSAARSAEGAYARGLRDTASGWAVAPGPPVIGRALLPREFN